MEPGGGYRPESWISDKTEEEAPPRAKFKDRAPTLRAFYFYPNQREREAVVSAISAVKKEERKISLKSSTGLRNLFSPNYGAI